MTLLPVLTRVVAVNLVFVAASALALVGPTQLRTTAAELPDRLREVAVPVGLLAGVLLLNSVVREPVTEVAWLVGINITPLIYGIEGDFVPWLQSMGSPALTTLFSYAYVYGYVYVLVFPLIAYAALEDTRPLRQLAIAYSVNYCLGLVCYVLFVAYGPRNLLGGSVESLLYTHHPEFQFLTSQVNSNTNVFPSLHTSLSATVIGVAYDTRRRYPGWFAIATALGLTIIGATMYLGIHWATDVVAGLVLAAIAVATGRRFAD
ncbi:phosphatase PAP2 family protein [Halosimplex aquaticum]|uniref:Phosphatase PAP2 family protein n=1 Tax=Halosimplex aquaticum TaxID=3026162 RepID=A0ABD5XVK4_9EURY|nr:phosphatase PAP2 family protein [Halosimplex aquaticum]